jgi:predicted Zn-dependent protease
MKKLFLLLAATFLLCVSCATNPLTGSRTMAFVGNDTLFPQSFAAYDDFLKENKVVTGTAEARMVTEIGERIRMAAEKWYASLGEADYLKDYRWEYHLVDSPEVNAWCMPGGKIVVYTGILPVTQNADALATVMGHEVSHALLNHGQQQSSADILTQVGAVGAAVLFGGDTAESQQNTLAVYSLGAQVLGTLPFSRKHETEADETGLMLMAIAGYNPEAAVPFWQRMNALGGAPPEFLSTHPSSSTRISNLQGWIPKARAKAAELR